MNVYQIAFIFLMILFIRACLLSRDIRKLDKALKELEEKEATTESQRLAGGPAARA
jgi:cell division protein FtsB